MVLNRILPFVNIALASVACRMTSNDEEIEQDSLTSKNDSLELTTEFVRRQLDYWDDSTIIATCVSNSDIYFLSNFNHDSICGYEFDSIPEYYFIKEDFEGVYIEFYCESSALIDVPSISEYRLQRFENNAFYGTMRCISPNTSDSSRIDSMTMRPWY